MYWPIGAPRIYAASNSGQLKNRIFEPEDDAESRETTEGSGELLDTPSVSSGGLGEGNDALSGQETPLTPKTPGIKPVEQNDGTLPILHNEDGSYFPGMTEAKEPLLALRMSRQGHLFAVITSTSLTIWQTKVLYLLPFVALMLIRYSLLLYWQW